MSRATKIVGKNAVHKDLGSVFVCAAVPGSFTLVEVEVLQRAAGWNEAREIYEPIVAVKPNLDVNGVEIGKTITRHTNTEKNDQYGHLDQCHVNDLTITP